MYNIKNLYTFSDNLDMAFKNNSLLFDDAHTLLEIVDGTIGLEHTFIYFNSFNNYLGFTSLAYNTLQEYLVDSNLEIDAAYWYLSDSSRRMDRITLGLAVLLGNGTTEKDKGMALLFILKSIARYFELGSSQPELSVSIAKTLVSLSMVLGKLEKSDIEIDMTLCNEIQLTMIDVLDTDGDVNVDDLKIKFMEMLYNDIDLVSFNFIPDLGDIIDSVVETLFNLIRC